MKTILHRSPLSSVSCQFPGISLRGLQSPFCQTITSPDTSWVFKQPAVGYQSEPFRREVTVCSPLGRRRNAAPKGRKRSTCFLSVPSNLVISVPNGRRSCLCWEHGSSSQGGGVSSYFGAEGPLVSLRSSCFGLAALARESKDFPMYCGRR